MSINKPGYDSRCCFCLWSQGDPWRAIQDNHKTVLHPLWEREHFYVDVEGEREKTFSVCRVLWSIAAYPLGMIGYLVDTILKLVLLIGNFFLFLIALFSCDTQWRRERGIFLVDNAAAVGIGVIGIVAPPLAYRLDKLAEARIRLWILSTPSKQYTNISTPRIDPPKKTPPGSGLSQASSVRRQLFADE